MIDIFQALNGIAKSYIGRAVWQFQYTAIPSITIQKGVADLIRDDYNFQIRLTGKDADGNPAYFFAEVEKTDESKAKAALNHPYWQIDNHIATRSYDAVALSNGDIVETAEYESKKAAYDAMKVTINTERKDKGVIKIVKFDPNVDLGLQKESMKLFAVPISAPIED